MWKAMFVVLVAVTACGGDEKSKGGGARGSAATGSGQQAGGNAASGRSNGSNMGSTYLGVTCDASTEGLAWCDSDTDLAFCTGGDWYLLDCSHAAIGGDFCAEDDDTVDCYAADEL